MRRAFDHRGWMDLGLGFVVGLVATGIVVVGLNALMGWHRVGVWERTLDERHSEDLEGADLQGALLVDADFRGAALAGASFFRAILNGADFSDAQVDRTNFSQAQMLNATLNHTSGTGPDFSQAILVNASLTGITDLRDARFDSAELAQCNMEGSSFPGAVFDHTDFTLASAVNVDFSEIESMNDIIFTGANLVGTRWNPARTERPWLVGSQGLDGRTLRDLKAKGGILHPEELLELIDREIVQGFRAQVDEDAEITEDQRGTVLFDLLRQYWMR